ncbi:MAG: hypothetical protein EOR30_29745 [Mesorhizobium sp.]|nr:hypothetical protein [Mesorhizobium sp.]RWI34143.1 MAG: hypothetical protein EOR14_31800 [Mesorhizobium sp.]RWI63207.1 MAG: hypothetical protein EOR17_29860 [Mesorhizobium sp.]RWI82477.1 MAG: hypothetical protein EOR20_26540 [Mesorhizobium sp.]RWJ43910.1 MAG: hypothetical protein EOR30_29745 [Mesorhizobium sp.]RWJ57417.1 MAG: hypothetical protein EOR32_29675 [Mesorhizobium sp.]
MPPVGLVLASEAPAALPAPWHSPISQFCGRRSRQSSGYASTMADELEQATAGVARAFKRD